MKAITLWQPWATCVARHGKTVENRTWAPPAWIAGSRIAIHAASSPRPNKGAERRVCEDLEVQLGVSLDPESLPRGAILATARVVGFVSRRARGGQLRVSSCGVPDDEVLSLCTRPPWFVGPIGWALDEVWRLAEPVPCKGAQGLWSLPDDVAQAVLDAPFEAT